jgi:hypothetical protein
MTKGQTTIYKTPHRKLKIEQRDPHWGEHRKGSQYILGWTILQQFPLSTNDHL